MVTAAALDDEHSTTLSSHIWQLKDEKKELQFEMEDN